MKGTSTINARRRTGRGLFAAVFGLGLLAAGCAETDRDRYPEGEVGVATFKNPNSRRPVWLGGCNTFVQERQKGSRWVDQEGEVVCFWEGFATPVHARQSRSDHFTTRTPGIWRLAYDVGIGCQADQPLSAAHCDFITRVSSNKFEVFAAGDEEALCTETGGVWDPLSCGHYSCGNPPDCDAIIPGCDCGSFSVFESEVGCLAAPCGAPQ